MTELMLTAAYEVATDGQVEVLMTVPETGVVISHEIGLRNGVEIIPCVYEAGGRMVAMRVTKSRLPRRGEDQLSIPADMPIGWLIPEGAFEELLLPRES